MCRDRANIHMERVIGLLSVLLVVFIGADGVHQVRMSASRLRQMPLPVLMAVQGLSGSGALREAGGVLTASTGTNTVMGTDTGSGSGSGEVEGIPRLSGDIHALAHWVVEQGGSIGASVNGTDEGWTLVAAQGAAEVCHDATAGVA